MTRPRPTLDTRAPQTGKRAATAWAKSLLRLVEYAAFRGVDRDRLLTRLELQPGMLDDADRRVPSTTYYRAVELCAAELQDPYLGLRFIAETGLTSVDAVGFLALASRTVGEALQRYVRHHPLVSEAEELHVERIGERVVIRLVNLLPRCLGQDHVTEMYAAGLLTRVPQLTGRPLEPVFISFTHPGRGSPDEYRRRLGRVPRFGAPHNEWAVPAAVLEHPLSRPDAALTDFFEKYLSGLSPHAAPLGTLLRAAVADGLVDGAVSLADVARRLAVTPRTLQRRLAQAGLSFERTLDEVRSSRARLYLDAELPLAEVSYLLGYADPATFHRAFRRWTGTTPKAWRQRRS